MRKWEHLWVTGWDGVLDAGENGWELVASDNAGFYLKREKVDAADTEKIESSNRQNRIIELLEQIADGIDRTNQL